MSRRLPCFADCFRQCLLVGTGNFSLDNIAFYQKCGFRLSHVRRGHFDAVDPPEFWQGIKLRDMIVFDWTPGEQSHEPETRLYAH